MSVRRIGPLNQMRASLEDFVNGDRVCWQTPHTKTLKYARDLLDFSQQHYPGSEEVRVTSP